MDVSWLTGLISSTPGATHVPTNRSEIRRQGHVIERTESFCRNCRNLRLTAGTSSGNSRQMRLEERRVDPDLCLDCFDVEGDSDVFADEDATSLERGVPMQTKVLTIDLRRGCPTDPRVAPG